MALSRHIAYGDGSNRTFGVPFPYINKSHVKVYVGDSDTPANLVWLSATEFQLAVAPANNEPVRVIRDTPKGSRLVSFSDGSRFPAQVANLDSLQMLFILQEIMEGTDIGGTLEELQGLVEAAQDAAADAADSAASLTLPLSVVSGGTGVSSMEELSEALELTDAARSEIGDGAGNLVALADAGTLPVLSGKNLVQVAGRLLQNRSVAFWERASVAGNVPLDDTIPQITEGQQIWAGSITPTSIGSYMAVTFEVWVSSSSGAITPVVFLCQEGNPDALVVSAITSAGTGHMTCQRATYAFIATSLEPVNLSLRAGGGGVATAININGAASRYFAAKMTSRIYMEEVDSGL